MDASSYDKAWSSVLSNFNTKLKQAEAATGERRKVIIREAEKFLDEAQSIISQIDFDSRNNISQRAKMQNKMRTFEQELDNSRKDLRRVADVNQRDNLLKSGNRNSFSSPTPPLQSDNNVDESLDQRNKILESTALLDRANYSLANAQRVSAENEEIGGDVLNMMDQQKETLLRARDGLDNINDNMKDARSIIANMGRRVVTNKIILGIFIIVLLGAIGLYLYLRWR